MISFGKLTFAASCSINTNEVKNIKQNKKLNVTATLKLMANGRLDTVFAVAEEHKSASECWMLLLFVLKHFDFYFSTCSIVKDQVWPKLSYEADRDRWKEITKSLLKSHIISINLTHPKSMWIIRHVQMWIDPKETCRMKSIFWLTIVHLTSGDEFTQAFCYISHPFVSCTIYEKVKKRTF